MLVSLLIALVCAGLSGVWVWLSWRKKAYEVAEIRIAAHAVTAAAVLIALFLTLDNHGSDDGLRLLAVFLSIATGMLLFLKRQRQRLFPQALMLAHLLCGLAAVSIVAWSLIE